jgi:N-methylhydantoinase B
MKNFLAACPLKTLRPGDVLITNDPWLTTGQLLDVTVCVPIFRRSRPVALFACTCHMVDIGGYGPGTGGTDVYEEGFQIPITKLYRAGRPNVDLFQLLAQNVRHAEHFLGDLQSMRTSCYVGGAKLLAMMQEYGLPHIEDVADQILARSEAAQRAAIARLPRGRYTHTTMLDGTDEPVRLAAAVTVSGRDITIDFAGSSPESRQGINVVLNYARGYATYAVRAALAPEVPNNDGSMAPIHVTAPPGCILNAQPPAPTTGRHLVGMFVALPVLGALAHAAPDRVVAEGAGAVWCVELRGRRPGGRQFTLFLTVSGGMGARPTKDGLNTTSFPSGIAGVPVEIWEVAVPVRVHRKAFRPDSGGAGRWRGGMGQTLEVSVASEGDWIANMMLDRLRFAAEGSTGGRPGAVGRAALASGEALPGKGRVLVKPEARIVLDLPGGGGYGAPWERDPELVREDVEQGFVTLERARDLYGVAITPAFTIDPAETRRLRGALTGTP